MNVTWTPRGNPTWVSVSSSATVATINYDLSSVSATSGEYNFAIQATANDGTTTYIPITLAIRLPLSLKATAQSGSIPVTRFDKNFSVEIKAYTESQINPTTEGVYYISPSEASMPKGMWFRTEADGVAFLFAEPCNTNNHRGGVYDPTTNVDVVVKVYKDGTLYDTPATAIDTTFLS